MVWLTCSSKQPQVHLLITRNAWRNLHLSGGVANSSFEGRQGWGRGSTTTAWDEKDGWAVKAEDVVSVSVEQRGGTVRTTFRPNPELSCPSYFKNHGNASVRGHHATVAQGSLLLSPVRKPQSHSGFLIMNDSNILELKQFVNQRIKYSAAILIIKQVI